MQWIVFSALLFFSRSLFAIEVIESTTSPLWELGAGGGGTYVPDYPGSDQAHAWAIPFPYIIYRGELLHSDRRGAARVRLVDKASYEINVSGAGGLPSSSANNHAREGMPDLEWLGEAGPRLMVDLYRGANLTLLRAGLPVRFAYSWDGRRMRDRGYLFAPELLFDDPHLFGTRFQGFILFTMNFADRLLSSYYYNVEPTNARSDRPAYASRAGYMMSDVSMGITIPFEKTDIKISLFGSVQTLHGAANQDSPLFRSPLNQTVSLVAVWVFGQSEIRVPTED